MYAARYKLVCPLEGVRDATAQQFEHMSAKEGLRQAGARQKVAVTPGLGSSSREYGLLGAKTLGRYVHCASIQNGA